MRYKKRYTKKIIPRVQVEKIRADFLKAAGSGLQLMIDMMECVPNVAFTVKDALGRIVHTNSYNVDVSGWRSADEMIGYTSEELYPPDQAAVYAGRDREVFETGKPIVNRIYGFVADHSSELNCVTVRPVTDAKGRIIGTATVYYRAQRKMQAAAWYNPIRRSIVYLNEHYAENVSVEKLAEIAHYSPAQFRKLFQVLMHLSPSDYITQVRVNAAKTLLTTTDRKIGDIALETGFFDHSHFIRTFRRATGLTPARYRRDRMNLVK